MVSKEGNLVKLMQSVHTTDNITINSYNGTETDALQLHFIAKAIE